jgi:hypothetical protein
MNKITRRFSPSSSSLSLIAALTCSLHSRRVLASTPYDFMHF